MSHEHASKTYENELSALRSRVIAMGALVEEQVRLALLALVDGRPDIGAQVVAKDRDVNDYDVAIDDDCAHVIAKRQPTASDLRMVLGASKVVTDLERVGDKARKIARLVTAEPPDDFEHRWREHAGTLGAQVRALLRDALNAFLRSDSAAAAAVCRRNLQLARQAQQLSVEIVQLMTRDGARIPRRLDMLTTTRSIDRIADHAANIGEHVIYIVHGTDVRHATLAEIEREAAVK